MHNAARRFTDLPAPNSDQEFSVRSLQGIVVVGVIGSVANAEAMARIAPHTAKKLYEVARAFSTQPIPINDQEFEQQRNESLAFVMRVGSLSR
jgi:hypothetical protein